MIAAAWAKQDPFGGEYVEVDLHDGALSAEGVAIGSDPLPYRLDYRLRTGSRYVTEEVEVAARGDGWRRSLWLRHDAGDGWSARVSADGRVALATPGGDTEPFAAALDVDLGLSPLFNSMPVLRHGIHRGGSTPDLLMVWISVPDLAIHPSRQRYRCLKASPGRASVVRFESIDEDEPFAADVTFDAHGIVLDYPGIGRRLR